MHVGGDPVGQWVTATLAKTFGQDERDWQDSSLPVLPIPFILSSVSVPGGAVDVAQQWLAFGEPADVLAPEVDHPHREPIAAR